MVPLRFCFVTAAALLLVAPAAATVPPLAPQDFRYAFNDDGELLLTWQPPPLEGSNPLDHYALYVVQDGWKLPPVAIPLSDPAHNAGVPTDGTTYAYYVAAVDTEGIEGPPTVPILIHGGIAYPRCTTFGWGLGPPPHADAYPGCLFPPPP